MDAPLTGVVPVVPTIFHDDQTVDLGGTARVVDYLIDAGELGRIVRRHLSGDRAGAVSAWEGLLIMRWAR